MSSVSIPGHTTLIPLNSHSHDNHFQRPSLPAHSTLHFSRVSCNGLILPHGTFRRNEIMSLYFPSGPVGAAPHEDGVNRLGHILKRNP